MPSLTVSIQKGARKLYVFEGAHVNASEPSRCNWPTNPAKYILSSCSATRFGSRLSFAASTSAVAGSSSASCASSRLMAVSRISLSVSEAGYASLRMRTSCASRATGSGEIESAVLKEIENRKFTDILVTTSGCAGLCSREPMATVELRDAPPVKYGHLTTEKNRESAGSHPRDKYRSFARPALPSGQREGHAQD